MKKISIVLVASLFTAVTGFSQVNFGIQAGANLAKVMEENDGQKQNGNKFLFGYKFGGVAKIPVSDQFSFMPELNYVAKGGKLKSTDVTVSGIVKTTIVSEGETKLSFIELPLNIAYTSASEDGSGFFGGLGPVISLGISGKSNGTATSTIEVTGFPTQSASSSFNGDVVFDGKANATDGKGHLKGLEFGGNIFAGYQLSNGLFAKATYNMGFSNLSPEDKTSFKTSYFGISLGYFFGQSK